MSIRFECGNCSRRLKVPEKKAGRRVICPECGHRCPVPRIDREDSGAKESGSIAKKQSTKPSRTISRGLLVGTATGSLAGGILLLTVWFLRKPATPRTEPVVQQKSTDEQASDRPNEVVSVEHPPVESEPSTEPRVEPKVDRPRGSPDPSFEISYDWRVSLGRTLPSQGALRLPRGTPPGLALWHPDSSGLFLADGLTVRIIGLGQTRDIGKLLMRLGRRESRTQRKDPNEEVIRALAVSSDAKTLIAGSSRGLVVAFDVATGTDERVSIPMFSVTCIDIDRDGRVAVGGGQGVRVFRLGEMTPREIPETADLKVVGVQFTSDGALWVAAANGTVRIVDDLSLKSKFVADPDGLSRMLISPDERYIATVSPGGMIRIHDLESKTDRFMLDAHVGRVRRLSFSPDSQILISTGTSFTFVWDLDSGQLTHKLKSGRGFPCVVSPSGTLVLDPDGRVTQRRVGGGNQ